MINKIILDLDDLKKEKIYKHDIEARDIFKDCIIDDSHEGYYFVNKYGTVICYYCINTQNNTITDIGLNSKVNKIKYNLDYVLTELYIYIIENYDVEHMIFREDDETIIVALYSEEEDKAFKLEIYTKDKEEDSDE